MLLKWLRHCGGLFAVTDAAVQVPVIAGVVVGVVIVVVIGILIVLIKKKRFVYLHHIAYTFIK